MDLLPSHGCSEFRTKPENLRRIRKIWLPGGLVVSTFQIDVL